MQNFNIYDCLQKGYKIDIGNTISKGWETFKAFAGGFIGYLLLYVVGASIIGMIPGANIALQLMQGALMIGFAAVAHNIVIGETPDFNNFFNGMRKNLGNYVVAALLTMLISLVFFLPLIIVFVSYILNNPEIAEVARYGTSEELGRYLVESMPSYIWVVFALTIIAFIPLGVAFMFVNHFIYFYELSATQALSASYRLAFKNFWSLVGLFFLIGLINILGFLCFCIGFLVTAPLSIIAIYHAFATLSGLHDNTGNGGDDEGKHLVLDHFR